MIRVTSVCAGFAGLLFVCAACRGGGATLPFGGILLDQEPANNMQAGSPVIPLDANEAKMGVLVFFPGDVDHFRVLLLAGESLTVNVTPLGGPVATPFTDPDVHVTIHDPGGTTLVDNENAGTDYPVAPVHGSVARLRAPAAGLYDVTVVGTTTRAPLYMVLVARSGVSPGGDLIEAEPNNSASSALFLGIPYCGPLYGVLSLQTPDDVDYFSIGLEAGQSFVMTTTPLQSSPTFTAPDTILTVFDRDGVTMLAESDDDSGNDNVGPTRGSTIRFRAPLTGNYYVRCKSFQSGTSGMYALMACVAPRLSYCPADVTKDGVVDAADLAQLLGAWGACP